MSSRFHPASEADFEEFKRRVIVEGGWSPVFEATKPFPHKAWTKKHPESPIDVIKVWSVYNDVSAETLYQVLHDAAYRTVWDEKMIEGFQVERIDDHNDISYYSAKSGVPGVSNRDFISHRAWKENVEIGEYIIYSRAVEHPAKPPQKNFVRGFSIYTGYVVRKDGDGCILDYMAQADPAGWIPKWLVNSLAKKFAPKICSKLYNACKAYDAWLKSGGRAPPAISHEEENEEEVEEENS